MKNLLFISFILLNGLAFSQTFQKTIPNPKYPELFKVIPALDGSEPEWILKLYSENPNFFEISKAFRNYRQTHAFEKNIHTQNLKHFSNLVRLNHYVLTNGYIYIPSVEEIEAQELLIANKSIPVKSSTANWTPIGPFETFNKEQNDYQSSQLNVYTFDQSISNPNVLYAGAETGPLFKSINKGVSWTPIAEDLTLKAGGAIKIDPANENIVFVSDGENKLYKTIDGGNTWTSLLNLNNLRINDIIVNGNVILIAGQIGLRRSTDGGLSWNAIHTEKCWDLEQKTDDPNTIFVAKSNNVMKRTEIWKSIDNGLTFTAKTSGWYSPIGGVATSNDGARIGVTNADPNRLYVVLLGEENDVIDDANFIGIYRSDDAGETWYTPYDGNNDGNPDNQPGGPYGPSHWCFSTFDPNDNGGYNQGFYNLALDVSDTDPNKFLVGFLNLFKSENGGLSYKEWGGYRCDNCGAGYRHPDIQEIEINGTDVWVATDGGLDLYNANLDFVESRINGLSGVNFWEIDQGWNEDVLVGGRYHNGNTGYVNGYGVGKFLSLGGGESATGYVNKAFNREVHFDDIQDVVLPTTLSGVVKPTSNYSIYPNQDYFLDGKSEVVNHPFYWNELYLGNENKIWKSINGGSTFDLLYTFGTDATQIVKGIEIARNNPSIIYAVQDFPGTDKLWKTTDAGLTWTALTLPFANSKILISIDETNADIIYVSNYIGGNGTNKVYISTNGGATWTNKTTTLLNGERIYFIKTQLGTQGGVYIATDYNVFYRNDTMSNWKLFSDGLPKNREPLKLMPFYKESKIRYALANRGVYESDFYEESLPLAQPMVAQKEQFCADRGVQFECYSVLNHNGASWQWSFPGASSVSSNTARNPLVYYSTPGTYDVSLTITDANGNSNTKTISNMIQVSESQCIPEPTPQNALACLGSPQYATNDNINQTNLLDFTFTAWIKPNGIQADYSAIFSLGDGEGNNKNVLNFRGGNNTLGMHWNGDEWWWDSGLIVPEDEWSFVGIKVENDLVTLYLNEQIATRAITQAAFDVNRIILGSYYEWNSRNYNGLIEEATFWKKALTTDEIRLSRHLSKMDVSDNDLIAYYQFNHNNANKIYDKKGGNDLNLNGGASIINSTAPFGDGKSTLRTIQSTGTYDFGIADASLVFDESTLPNGAVVVTHITSNNPNNLPLGVAQDEQYFVINNYGSNTTFDPLGNIQLKQVGDISGADTSLYFLSARASNSDIFEEWGEIAFYDIANKAQNWISFPGDNMNTFGQYYITKSTFADTSNVAIQHVYTNENAPKVYPNPLLNGNELFIDAKEYKLTFSLINAAGKEIEKHQLEKNESIQIKNLATGIYFYLIQTDTKIYSNKLVIK